MKNGVVVVVFQSVLKDASYIKKMQQNFLKSLSLMACMILGDTF